MNSHAMPVLRAVILAAGSSRRLGQPKALARIKGLSLLRQLVRLIAPLLSTPPLIVVPPRCARYRLELRGIDVVLEPNRHRLRGLSSSVRLGLARGRFASAALLLPVDLALLERRDIARLIAHWRAARRRVAARRIGLPGNAQGGAHGGVPLILPRRFFARAQLIDGDTGLRDWLRTLSGAQCRLVEMPSAALDIDTPKDLARARRTARCPQAAGGCPARPK